MVPADIDAAYVSIVDARRSLGMLEEQLQAARDPRAIFVTAYVSITDELDARISKGGFDDPVWVERYVIAFANRYRAAMLGFERGDRVAESWQVAFSAAARGKGLAIQHLVLGMNAHINYDLPLALLDVTHANEMWARRRDFAEIETALLGAVDAIQDRIAATYAPGLSVLDVAFGRLDELVAAIGIRYIRATAWRNAERIAGSRDDTERERWVDELDRETGRIARAVLWPTDGRPRFEAALRWIERSDPLGLVRTVLAPRRGRSTMVERSARKLRLEFRRTVPISAEQLWPLLTDPIRMNEWSSATVTLVEGVCDVAGARREVRISTRFGVVRLDEVIDYAARPHVLRYRVLRGIGVRRHLGEMTVTSVAHTSELTWAVTMELYVPGATLVAERVLVPQLEASLDALVRAAGRA